MLSESVSFLVQAPQAPRSWQIKPVYPQRGEVLLSRKVTHYHEVTLDIRSDATIKWPKSGGTWSSRYCPDWPGGEYFIIHERCWQYMLKCFGQEFVGVEKLYDILRSIAPPRGKAYCVPKHSEQLFIPVAHYHQTRVLRE